MPVAPSEETRVDTVEPVVIEDSDGDGFSGSEDCDDNNSQVNPSIDEICDGIDNNCNGEVDEGVTSTFYADTDGDGFGDEGTTLEACEQQSGYVDIGNDCNDTTDTVFPGAPELCDGLDNDCDELIDEDVTTTFYADGDGDGFGDPEAPLEDCAPPSGYVADNTDCDDTAGSAYPGGTETCDDLDNDCNGVVDDGVTTTYYADGDGDGFGLSDATTEACLLPTGYAESPGDCNDKEEDINPDADEVCDDVDNNCDDEIDEGCRPDAGCTHPDTTTLADYDPTGVSDIVFADDCVAYVSTIISGQDYVYMIESDGSTSYIKGYSVWNIQSLAIDPSTGDIAISHNDNSNAGIGVLGTASAFPNTVSFTYNYLNPSAGRSVLLQEAIDVTTFVGMLEETVPLDLGAPVGLIGHSQGAEVGAMLAAVEPRLQAYVLHGVGTYLSETIVHRTDPFDVAALLEEMFGTASISRFHPIIQLVQVGADVVDPGNYLAAWPDNGDGSSVLIVNGYHDQDVYWVSMNTMVVGSEATVVEPPGWDVDPEAVWSVDSAPLPISGNRDGAGGVRTVVAWLDADGDHYSLYGDPHLRPLASHFFETASTGVPEVPAPASR